MFVGHYAFGFFLKRKFNEIPLWQLFISVQFVDMLAFFFVLLGVEQISYNETANPFLRTVIEYVPFTHSLFSNCFIALIVFVIFWQIKNKTWGFVLSIGILSHWFLDVFVHMPDMPLIFNSYKTGLGLWQFPRTAFIIELTLLVLTGFYLLNYACNKRLIVIIILLITGYLAMFFAPEAEATPTQASILSLSLYTIFTALAYWSDRINKL
jgi:membrane-bound metal-dependent hydrolase YbcI (DUF457 family)